MSKQRTQQILRDAARLIQLHGHAVGQYQDERGRLCAFGALRRAAGAPSGDAPTPTLTDDCALREAHRALAAWLKDNDPDGRPMDLWSDDSEADQVIAGLLAAQKHVL